MIQSVIFYALSAAALVGALGVVLARNPIYAVLSLVTALFGIAGLFALLGALFVAMIQILVYAGAILILFLFVVMLLDMAPEQILRMRMNTLRVAGALVGCYFLWQVLTAIRSAAPSLAQEPAPVPGTTAAIGRELFTTYALPFEVASLILLVGVIGAVVLAKKRVS